MNVTHLAAGARITGDRGCVWPEQQPAPVTGVWLHIDIDATLVIDHSDNKQRAAPTWKKTTFARPHDSSFGAVLCWQGALIAGVPRRRRSTRRRRAHGLERRVASPIRNHR